MVAGIVVAIMAAWLWWPRPPAGSATEMNPGTGPGGGGPVLPLPAGPVVEPEAAVFARYAGSESCRDCHTNAFWSWQASNHGMAERLPDERLDREAFDPPRSFAHGSQTSAVAFGKLL